MQFPLDNRIITHIKIFANNQNEQNNCIPDKAASKNLDTICIKIKILATINCKINTKKKRIVYNNKS